MANLLHRLQDGKGYKYELDLITLFHDSEKNLIPRFNE